MLRLSLILFTAIVLSPVAQAQDSFKVRQRIVLGGEGSWDYLTVDAPSHRLYIAHQFKVDVVDLTAGRLVGSINGLTRAHGVVIMPDGKSGFISDGGGNRIVVFEPKTLATVGTIPAGKNPDGIIYEASTKTLWAFNGASKDATVIDVTTRKVIATLPMPGKPEFPATDGAGVLFVNVEDNNSIVRIDAGTRKITATWPLKGCEGPSGLAFDRAGARLFSVCDGKAMPVTDSRTGKNLGIAKVGDGPDAAGFDPKRQLAFASNEDGTLSIIDTSKPSLPTIQTLSTMVGARTMALDAESGTVYSVGAKLGAMPAPTPGIAHTRRTPIPGTFTLLVISR